MCYYYFIMVSDFFVFFFFFQAEDGIRDGTVTGVQTCALPISVRGGGGNFGVVTSFFFQAHPVHTVCAGPMLWHLEDAADLMRWYREFITQAQIGRASCRERV